MAVAEIFFTRWLKLPPKVIAVLLLATLVLGLTLTVQGPTAAARASIQYPALSMGSRGANVTAAQHLLIHHGVTVPLSGEFDSTVDQAVKRFQRSKGLLGDGEIGTGTWTKLVDIDLERGDSGQGVQALTTLLDKFDGGGTATVFGPTVTRRLADFQRHQGLRVSDSLRSDDWRHLSFHYIRPEISSGLCRGLNGRTDTANYNEAWGTSESVAALEWVGAQTRQRYGVPVAFRDLSLEHGGAFPLFRGSRQHQTHRFGMDVDLRPMSTSNFHCTSGLTFRSSRYSQARTAQLIEDLEASGEVLGRDLLKFVFFNDPQLVRRYPKVRYVSGHDNHLHASFCASTYAESRRHDC